MSQEHSRSPLKITRDLLIKLLEKVNAFPELVNVLALFTRMDNAILEGRACYYSRMTPDGKSQPLFETAYIFKHVEANGRAINPWSIRKLAIHQQVLSSEQSKSILVECSLLLQDRFKSLFGRAQATKTALSWLDTHIATLATLGSNWQAYIQHLEGRLSNIVSLRSSEALG